MADIAFGTQKISIHNPQHIQALKEAIKSGIKMIITSSEYLHGDANRAVAVAFREFEYDDVADVEIVSKFSYKENEDIAQKLSDTLKELELEQLDCYMFYKVENHLRDAFQKGMNQDERFDYVNDIIYQVFVALEQEVKEKRIKTYGIGSESFALNPKMEYFFPYEDLIALADMAAKKVGNKQNSLTTIEIPINLLEQEGLKCASWAKKNGLRVIASRALSGVYENQIYRLASYDESATYYNYLNELLEICDNETLQSLYNLIEELDATKHKFGWVEDFDHFFFTQAIPHIQKVLQDLDTEYQETMIQYIDIFFAEYRKMVAYECSLKTKKLLDTLEIKCPSSLQECAIEFLEQQENIDFIEIGMRKPSYVNEFL
ncbi:hypothetical protein MNB_SM-3-535 [hydrothermal vent metagenome]|uniref:NADP-dependent oxidoreductase domain-containing protein n=1 Tax=hydrothermal vent metagenome TaxID=652676 RepID=A0A1W1D251_9ZZZZ